MAPSRVVEGRDVLEYRRGQLGSGLSAPAVEELELEAGAPEFGVLSVLEQILSRAPGGRHQAPLGSVFGRPSGWDPKVCHPKIIPKTSRNMQVGSSQRSG